MEFVAFFNDGGEKEGEGERDRERERERKLLFSNQLNNQLNLLIR